MATDVDALLHDVLVFMQQLLGLSVLPAEAGDRLRGLVTRLQQHEQTEREKPSYLDMKSTLTLKRLHPTLDAALTQQSDDAANQWLWTPWPPQAGAGDHAGRGDSVDGGDPDTSADCSECLEDSADEWPPRGAPSCPRPDLSPFWAVSAGEARAQSLHSGAVNRGGPGRWFRVHRRSWAAVLATPARLLVFSGARSSRPRLVLPLAPPAPGGAAPCVPCSEPCCAVYTARPHSRADAPAFELCCPGRKTHQMWVSDEKEAQSWVEALRRAAQGEAPSSTATPTAATPQTDAPPRSPNASDCPPNALDTSVRSARSGSRSRSESRSTSVLSDHQRDHLRTTAESTTTSEGESERTPPTPPPEQQQQYESMLSAAEEIYHDIAPVSSPQPAESLAPSYANVGGVRTTPTTGIPADDEDSQARPLYDDVAVPPKPMYCNLQPGRVADEGDEEGEVPGEHLYDDIGLGPADARASVYELIQDPVVGQGIRCS